MRECLKLTVLFANGGRRSVVVGPFDTPNQKQQWVSDLGVIGKNFVSGGVTRIETEMASPGCDPCPTLNHSRLLSRLVERAEDGGRYLNFLAPPEYTRAGPICD